MDITDVFFSSDFVRKLEDIATIRLLSTLMPEDQAAPVAALLRAFSRHGVPVKTVLEVFQDLAQEEGSFGGK